MLFYWLFVLGFTLTGIVVLAWMAWPVARDEYERIVLVDKANLKSEAAKKYGRWWHR